MCIALSIVYSQIRCSVAGNIAILSRNIAILIGWLLLQIATDTNKLQVEIHKRFVNKASDWTIRKREAPIQLLRLFDWLPSFLKSNQRLCLQIFCEFQLAICSCLLQFARAISRSILQYCVTILQCCLQGNIRFYCTGILNFDIRLMQFRAILTERAAFKLE
jgi:hypothetical protein